jgi:hypothetical protein
MIKLLIILLLPVYTFSQVLDGSLSENASKYRWSQVSGNVVTLKTPDSIKCKVEGFKDGIYVFRLTVFEGLLSDSDDVTVTCIKGALSVVPDSIRTRVRAQFKLKVTPELKIILQSDRTQNITLNLYDVVGRRLEEKQVYLRQGDNYLELKKPSSGVYILNLQNDWINQSKKIIVQ